MSDSSKILTVLEAYVPEEKWAKLQESFAHITASAVGIRPLQSQLVQSQQNPEFWSIFSLWQDMATLQQMRKREAVPAGIRVFKEVGAEPTLSILEVRSEI